MPRVSQDYLDARRRDILRAAHRCFARDGFHATTMRTVAREAGLSAGALYRYFDGKEALIEALAARGREAKRGALEALERDPGPRALGRMAGTLLGYLEDAPEDALRLDVRLWGEALDHATLRRIVTGELAALREPIAAHARRERMEGRMPDGVAPEALARVIVALLAGLELQASLEPDIDAPACAVAVRALLDGLGDSEPPPPAET